MHTTPELYKRYLERLYECPEEDADRVSLSEQLDEPGRSEETQEAEADEGILQRRQSVSPPTPTPTPTPNTHGGKHNDPDTTAYDILFDTIHMQLVGVSMFS